VEDEKIVKSGKVGQPHERVRVSWGALGSGSSPIRSEKGGREGNLIHLKGSSKDKVRADKRPKWAGSHGNEKG